MCQSKESLVYNKGKYSIMKISQMSHLRNYQEDANLIRNYFILKVLSKKKKNLPKMCHF